MTDPLEQLQAHCRALFFADDGTLTVPAEEFLRDLFAFCGVNRSGAVIIPEKGVDPYASMIQVGRQEVALRVIELLHLDRSYITNLRRQYRDG